MDWTEYSWKSVNGSPRRTEINITTLANWGMKFQFSRYSIFAGHTDEHNFDIYDLSCL